MIDPNEVTRELRTGVSVEEHVAGGGDGLRDIDKPTLRGDRSLDVQDPIHVDT